MAEGKQICRGCTQCDKLHFAPWPDDLAKAGLVGPRLTAFIGFLKGACHMSFSSMRKFLRDVVKVTISRGQLRKLIGKVSESLADPYAELLRLLPQQKHLNVDETGLWTVAATCSQTDRSVFEFITAAVIANFQGGPAPSLVSDTS